jgi:hypothetical protein
LFQASAWTGVEGKEYEVVVQKMFLESVIEESIVILFVGYE